MKNLKFILVSISLLLALNLSAQSQSDMSLNEILVTNTTDFQDDFGQHNAWVELFNTSYGTVNIGGCYLTNDINNLTKYIIPKGDILTKIKPRQHILFWADEQPFRGTFHLNFSLEGSDEVILVGSDGRTIIDRIPIPKNLSPNQSYGRMDDGIGSKDGSGEGWETRRYTSPSTNNAGVDAETKSAIMKKADPYGWIMAFTAMSVVFFALILLYLVFKLIGKAAINSRQRTADKARELEGEVAISVKETSAETYAAISMALYLYHKDDEAHDAESLVVTIGHTDRTYSPWSSKIYGLRQLPSVKK